MTRLSFRFAKRKSTAWCRWALRFACSVLAAAVSVDIPAEERGTGAVVSLDHSAADLKVPPDAGVIPVPGTDPIRIAVITFALPRDNLLIAEATKLALAPLFPNRGIKLIFCTFEEFDRIVREQALATPILFWIGLSRLPEGADGLPRLKAWTNGLARFDKLEMEIPSTAADIHDAFILLNSAACYVLDHDAQMQPGEALEWKDGEVPLSLGKSSAIDEDQDVLIVDLDGLRPRGDGVVENKDEGEA